MDRTLTFISMATAATCIAITSLTSVFCADSLLFTVPIQEVSASAEATDVHAAYAFTNASDHAVTISEIKTSCGCTTAELEKRTYKTGESGTIDVIFDIGSRTASSKNLSPSSVRLASKQFWCSRSIYHLGQLSAQPLFLGVKEPSLSRESFPFGYPKNIPTRLLKPR